MAGIWSSFDQLRPVPGKGQRRLPLMLPSRCDFWKSVWHSAPEQPCHVTTKHTLRSSSAVRPDRKTKILLVILMLYMGYLIPLGVVVLMMAIFEQPFKNNVFDAVCSFCFFFVLHFTPFLPANKQVHLRWHSLTRASYSASSSLCPACSGRNSAPFSASPASG